MFSPDGTVGPVLALSIQTPRNFTTSAFPTAERFSAAVRSGASEGGAGERRRGGKVGETGRKDGGD